MSFLVNFSLHNVPFVRGSQKLKFIRSCHNYHFCWTDMNTEQKISDTCSINISQHNFPDNRKNKIQSTRMLIALLNWILFSWLFVFFSCIFVFVFSCFITDNKSCEYEKHSRVLDCNKKKVSFVWIIHNFKISFSAPDFNISGLQFLKSVQNWSKTFHPWPT